MRTAFQLSGALRHFAGCSPRPHVFAALALIAFLPLGEANKQCLDMYKVAFAGREDPANRPKPDEVPKLFKEYCKFNMRSGSTKSMDELCAPIAAKVADKMLWVPPDYGLTAQEVCKTIAELKELFPIHAKEMEEVGLKKKKEQESEEAKRAEIAKNAQNYGNKVSGEVNEMLRKASDSMKKDLKASLEKNTLEMLGGEMDEAKKQLTSKFVDGLLMGMRGLESSLKRKYDEALKEWAKVEAKKLLDAAKEKEKPPEEAKKEL